MAPPIASAKATLSYPLYAADFDPHNCGFLLVGGGGGEGRSGVGNKISLLNTSRKAEISEVIEIDLSRDEDSVTTLAVARSSETSVTALAGINSSSAEQQAGRNEHLRAFRISYPPRKRTSIDGQGNDNGEVLSYTGETKALGKASLFTPSSAAKKETYQRVLRLSRARTDSPLRIGAVATGLTPEAEIVVFDASSSRPSEDDVRGRIRLERKEEAGDVDITEGKDGEYLIAYCTDYDVYLYDLQSTTKESTTKPQLIYSTPHPDAFAKTKARPTFRSLRFLTSNLVLLLQNLPSRTGAELLLLEVPTTTSLGRIILRKGLHKGIKSASGLTTALLAPIDPSTQDKTQHVIAVAGADISITIFTLDLPLARPKLTTHAFLTAVHPLQITGLTLSTFHPPSIASTAPAQYVKLASISMGSTVVVHTLPLSPYPAPTSKAASKDSPRYVLTVPGRATESAQLGFSVLVSIIVVALGAFLLQAWTEIRGGTPEYLGAKGWLSERVHGWVARPYMFESVDTPVITADLPKVENVREKAKEMNEEGWEGARKVSEDVTDRAEVIRQAVEDAIKKGMPGVEDVKSVIPEIPSVKEVKQKIPSVKDVKGALPATEDVQNAMPDMPSMEDVKEKISEMPNVKSAMPETPSAEVVKDKMPGMANVESAMPDMPSGSDDINKVEDIIPSMDDVKDAMPDIPDVTNNLPNTDKVKDKIPTTDDIKDAMPAIPAASDITDKLPNINKVSIPSVDDVKGVMPDIPSASDITDKLPNTDNAKDTILGMDDIKDAMPDIPPASDITNNLPNTDTIKDRIPSASNLQSSLRHLLSLRSHLSNSQKSIIVRDAGSSLSASTHDHPHDDAKRWEELSDHERESWRERLVQAGEWTVEQGEAVLQGVFFGGVAEAVGRAVVGG